MTQITGVVKAVSHKFDKLGVKIEETWYSTKKEYAPSFEINSGDEITFDNKGRNYLNSVKMLKQGGASSGGSYAGSTSAARAKGFPVGIDTKDRSIVRQNSLSHAVNIIGNLLGPLNSKTTKWEDTESQMEKFAELAIDLARQFENYSSGDGDASAASDALTNAVNPDNFE